jgi:hypothetical protein
MSWHLQTPPPPNNSGRQLPQQHTPPITIHMRESNVSFKKTAEKHFGSLEQTRSARSASPINGLVLWMPPTPLADSIVLSPALVLAISENHVSYRFSAI